jgi:hypothetical protein
MTANTGCTIAENGETYVSRAGWGEGGPYLAKLEWQEWKKNPGRGRAIFIQIQRSSVHDPLKATKEAVMMLLSNKYIAIAAGCRTVK